LSLAARPVSGIRRSLAAAGAEITLAVRDTEADARVADDITIATGNDHLHVALWTSPIATQSDFSSATGKGLWTSWLVDNAGVILPTLERTAEGWEKTVCRQPPRALALSTGLHDALAAAGEPFGTLSTNQIPSKSETIS